MENIELTSITSQDAYNFAGAIGKILCEKSFAQKRSELKKASVFIDASKVTKHDWQNVEWKDYIPPYKDGVMKRYDMYIAFHIENIDFQKRVCQISLYIYLALKNNIDIRTIWAPAYQFFIDIFVDDEGTIKQKARMYDYKNEIINMSFDEVIQYLPQYDAGLIKFTTLKEFFTLKMPEQYYNMIGNVINASKNFKSRDDSVRYMAKDILYLFVEINRLMTSNAKKQAKEDHSSRNNTHIKYKEADTPEKRHTYVIGSVTIEEADNAQKPSFSKSAHRTYTCAEWEVRGHTRTLKSGRQIYVRPTTAKRHFKELETQKIKKKLIFK